MSRRSVRKRRHLLRVEPTVAVPERYQTCRRDRPVQVYDPSKMVITIAGINFRQDFVDPAPPTTFAA